VKKESRGKDAGIWLRLLGFALIPLAVQSLQPAVGSSLGILTPLPLAYGMARRGYLEGTGAVALVALITSLTLGSPQGLYFFLETLPLTVGIGWTARSRAPLYQSVVLAIGIVVLTAAAAVGVYSVTTGTPLAQVYQQTVQQMGTFMNTVTQNAKLNQQQQQEMLWTLNLWKRFFVGIWVSTLTLLVLFYALVTRGWLLTAGVIKKDGLALLTRWKLPFPFVGGFVVLAVMVLLTHGLAREIALNCLLPLGTFYGIQGIVIAGHMFTRWSMPPIFRTLVLLFGIMAIPITTMVTMSLTGLFDTWIDFRRRWPIEKTPPPASA